MMGTVLPVLGVQGGAAKDVTPSVLLEAGERADPKNGHNPITGYKSIH